MHNHIKINKNLMVLSIFKVELFFSIAAFWGYTYLGSESSSIYVVLMTAIGILNIGLGLSAINKSHSIKIREVFLLVGFPLFVFTSFIFEYISSSSAIAIQQSQFNFFLAFTLPSLFIGWYVAKNKVDLFYPIFFVMVLISAGSIASILVPFISGQGFRVMGGASYQAASYYTSFAFGLNLYILIYKSNHTKSKRVNTFLIKFLQMILLLFQSIMVIIPGGRGAFVLMLVYFVLVIPKMINKRNVVHFILSALIVLIFGLFLMNALQRLLENSIFQRGFNRAVAFIGPGGTLNWEGAAGRLPIYLEAIELFKQSPVIGYGLYGYLGKVSFGIYPHNFFLEVLLQGGFLYLLLWVISIWYLLRKLHFLIRLDERNRVYSYLGLFPAVMLMFSGSYLTNGLLWFMISFLTFYRKKINDNH